MPEQQTVEIGDTVFVGRGEVHWIVEEVGESLLVLRSGKTDRHRTVWADEVTIRVKGENLESQRS